MAPAQKLACVILSLLFLVAPLRAVTTPEDVRKALDSVASYQTQGEEHGAFSPELAARLQLLRRRARDFAFGSVLDAARHTRDGASLLTKARQRTLQAGIPLRGKAAWMTDQFSPSVRIQYFPVQDANSWVGARVHVGIPCGEDVSLYLWKLDDDEESGRLVPELTFARESPLTDLATSTGTLHVATRLDSPDGVPQLATIETGVWCNSQWRKALLQVVRGSDHPYRPERIFTHDELAFVGADNAPTVERTASGFRFHYLSQYWLDPRQHSRVKRIDLRIEGGHAEIMAPLDENPALFLDHWLTEPWTTSRAWTTGENLNALRTWHDSLSPNSPSRVAAELLGQGGCQGDPTTFFVQLHTEKPDRGQTATGQNVYGILKRQADGFRVQRIASELPSGCDLGTALGTGQAN